GLLGLASIFFLFVAMHSMAMNVFCQQSVSGATLSGVVRDANGSSLSGAAVTAVNLETNRSSRETTDRSGYFRFQYLPVGSYQIKTEQPGFAPLIQTLTVTIGQSVFLELKMNVEGLNVGVEVEADSEHVETTRTQVAETVTPKEINNQP